MCVMLIKYNVIVSDNERLVLVLRCYLIRHGQDDESRRGGWSMYGLTDVGVETAKHLGRTFARHIGEIGEIFSSDLPRAMETAIYIGEALSMPIHSLPAFREVNNGVLAGMPNTVALEEYPGLFWHKLAWDEPYPEGESPAFFAARIAEGWKAFTESCAGVRKDRILVTHSGVIRVILALVEGRQYSHLEKGENIAHGGIVALRYDKGIWKRTGVYL